MSVEERAKGTNFALKVEEEFQDFRLADDRMAREDFEVSLQGASAFFEKFVTD